MWDKLVDMVLTDSLRLEEGPSSDMSVAHERHDQTT